MIAPTTTTRRGSVLLIVMWALALGAIVLSSVQLFSYRQAMLGREATSRVQARWAARGGIEYAIAIMADHTLYPVADDAFAMVRELDQYAQGEYEVGGRVIAGYDIRHHADGRDWWGPMDEHSKINVNLAPDNPTLLMNLPEMGMDVADAIQDWIDDDDDIRPLGAEREYYLSLSTPYEPRNGPMLNIAELELVAGIWPQHVRGEDWNYNCRLDPNENDGDRTWPMDEPDDRLDAGWFGMLTASSTTGGLAASGLPRIRLSTADPAELQERLGLDETQAAALIGFGKDPEAGLENLLTMYLQQQAASDDPTAPQAPGTSGAFTLILNEAQLRAVLAETTMTDPMVRGPGKLNINTASEAVLRQMFQGKEYLADEIVYLRSQTGGISSMVDLLSIPAFQQDTASLELVARTMDVSSNVYTICAKGRCPGSGVEVEVVAVVDRSILPIRILEYREQ